MFLRKGLGFIITSLLSSLFITLTIKFQESYVGIEFFVFVLFITAPIIFVYGLPVSILSDTLTKKFKKNVRSWSALFIHLLFGMMFVFLYGLLMARGEFLQNMNGYWNEADFYFYCSVLTSVLFWGVDEMLRRSISLMKATTMKTNTAS